MFLQGIEIVLGCRMNERVRVEQRRERECGLSFHIRLASKQIAETLESQSVNVAFVRFTHHVAVVLTWTRCAR